MAHTFFITSAAYIGSEQVAEFGLIPPTFLPLGKDRLYVHQYEALREFASRIILTLPDKFEPDPIDASRLEEMRIEIVYVPEDLSLGESIVYAINMTASSNGAISILHGDSLLTDVDYGECDAVSLADTAPPPGYGWGWARQGETGLQVHQSNHLPESSGRALTGFFSFADTARFVQAVTRNHGNFVAGLAEYAAKRPMKMLTSGHWYDFGHSGTYHRSRRRITTEREFNKLTTAGRSITKTGTKPEKLLAEAMWFEELPPQLRVYTPQYLGRDHEGEAFSYSLEYLHLPTVADLSVFGRLEVESWKRIFLACDEVITALCSCSGPSEALDSAASLYADKTLQRLDVLARTTSLSLDKPCRYNGKWLPSLSQIVEITTSQIADPKASTLVHGDFCFSNILYDVKADLVRMIDPRGMDANGRMSIYGDIRYDVAKLYHSAVGLYDHIIAGNFAFERNGDLEFSLELPSTPSVRLVRDVFLEQRFAGMTTSQASALPISILLFLSMPPLHSDDPKRQMALLANGLRLFSSFQNSME